MKTKLPFKIKTLLNENLKENIVVLSEHLDERIFEFDLVYADVEHPWNAFGQIYKPTAKMLGHTYMVQLLTEVGNFSNESFGWTLKLLDCLRPYEAQIAMSQASNLPSSLLSTPGHGAHPRGLAIDLQPYKDGKVVNFGSYFDDFSASGIIRSNRSYAFIEDKDKNDILSNRYRLDMAFQYASSKLELPITGVKTEWWDYRVPNPFISSVEAIRDCDLPENLQMTTGNIYTNNSE